MNTQNYPTQASQTSRQLTTKSQQSDQFSQSLVLWIASFPLFALGLALSSFHLHTIGMIMQLAAAVCFFSPITLLLGCLTDRD